MKSESCRWLTAITLLFLAYPATLAPTMAVGRPCTPASVPGPWAAKSQANDAESTAGVTASMAQLPISFEPNVGQTDAQVAFLVRGAGYGAFLTNEELVLSCHKPLTTPRPPRMNSIQRLRSPIDPSLRPKHCRRPSSACDSPAPI